MKATHSIPIAVALGLASGAAVANDALQERAQMFFDPIPDSAAGHIAERNEMTPEKVELGKLLFFDPRLSASQTISCNTCHNVGMGGDDNIPSSVGHNWQRGPRNSPTIFNAVFNVAQFWDGRAEDMTQQAKGPIQAGVEMNNTPDNLEATLQSIDAYVDAFEDAFPDSEQAVSFDNTAKALEVYQATLITPDAPFDQYLKGDKSALTDQQIAGLDAFVNKGCVACHNGVNVGGQGYYPFGVVNRPGADVMPEGDTGRAQVTKTAADEYVFRSPSLRNVELTAPYFHSGNVWSLQEAVSIMNDAQLNSLLTEEDVVNVTAFLRSLTGDQPEVVYPELPISSEDTPMPDIPDYPRATSAEG
ncbi:cytochrome-c peroxidase [Spiribacter vilamensis]|uniref:Cytochrome c peroxidase n=1 Tax=Spiribacter vilamensis TaxID=531306 RepID=A0A4Q8D1R8_9GAMM|nr:cytochrome-c peroxidase [Spiribacter vilamensis]RZU99326.1 cytochrome c peroxidase [Spiribacter vilamensis]TVO61690.1 cytochrome-c peroxidase [Spiribacter vilamensis]